MALQIYLQYTYHVSHKFETPIRETYKVWEENIVYLCILKLAIDE